MEVFGVSKRTYKDRRRLFAFLISFGPGITVMLADTDAGSVVTAAQSGAQWEYKMILPQIVLIPILYLIQEITLRLGVVTRKGHGELIREKFGLPWALISVVTLFVASVGALVTEYAGLAGVSELFGVSRFVMVPVAMTLMIGLGVFGQYRRVERIGIAIGLFELCFIPAAILGHPQASQMVRSLASMPWRNPGYLYLLAANVGAVVMPWMVFYQQGAVVDKGLRPQHLRRARFDTALGAVLTQIIMIAVIVTTAATIGRVHPGQSLSGIEQIGQGLVPFMGFWGAKLAFGLGLVGASLVAALVVSLAGAWGVGEVFGFNHSLNHTVREAKPFYAFYALAHVGGAAVVLLSFNLVALNIDVEVMNAALLPIVIGFLLALEAKALPPEWRMAGFRKYLVWGAAGLIMAFGLYTGIANL